MKLFKRYVIVEHAGKFFIKDKLLQEYLDRDDGFYWWGNRYKFKYAAFDNFEDAKRQYHIYLAKEKIVYP